MGLSIFFPLPFAQLEVEKLVIGFHSMTRYLDKKQTGRMSKLQYIHIVTFSISGKPTIVILFQNLHRFS